MGKTKQGKPNKLQKTKTTGKKGKTVKGAAPAGRKNPVVPLTADEIYRQLFNLSPNAIAVFKPEDGTICNVNDFLCQGSGYSREEIIGRTSQDLQLFSQDIREKALACIAKDGCFRGLEVQHRLKDGSMVTCLDSGDLVKIGDEYYVIVVAQDITHIKNIEEALHNEHNLNKAIINNLPGLFYVIDEYFRFQLWNDNYTRITGYTSDDLRRMSALNLAPPDKRSSTVEKIKSGFDIGESSGEGEIVCKDGSFKTFLFNSKIIDYKGKRCMMGMAMDITDKKKSEEDLNRFAESLEDANIALRVLINHSNNDKKMLEDKLQTNINDLVMPYIDKLKNMHLDERSRKFISILETNLGSVLSPFMTDLREYHKKMTPQEMQIIDLIRKGKITKEIASILNVSVNTIATHRNNIRKKLNLRKTKSNLRSYVRSIK